MRRQGEDSNPQPQSLQWLSVVSTGLVPRLCGVSLLMTDCCPGGAGISGAQAGRSFVQISTRFPQSDIIPANKMDPAESSDFAETEDVKREDEDPNRTDFLEFYTEIQNNQQETEESKTFNCKSCGKDFSY